MQGFALAAALLLLSPCVLVAVQDAFNYTSDVLLFLLAVIVVALIGGLWPAS